MRLVARSLVVGFVALLGVVGLAMAWTMTTAVALQAATALILGGADHPLMGPKDSPAFVTAYLNNAVDSYINSPAAADAGTAGPVDNAVAVAYPAEFFPVFGSKLFDQTVAEGRENLHNCLEGTGCVFNDDPAVDPAVGSEYPPPSGDDIVVFSFSESAVVASLVKRDLVDNYVPGDMASFFLVSNAMRGNGGILMRGFGLPSIPFLGITFYGATSTDSEVVDDGGTPEDPTDDTYAYPTVDVAQQYDFFGGDAPYRLLNLLATINSLAAYYYLHGDTVNRPLTEAQYQGRLGDTTYYLFPARTLPILMPLEQLGVPSPIVRFLDTMTRVAVEDAYLRGVNPGVPTAGSLMPIGNPIALALNLLAAIPVAIDDASQEMGLGRPLGTTPAGPYGVGGPPLPEPPSALSTTAVSALSAQTEAVEGDDAESVAPESQSLAGEEPAEPEPDPEPAADDNDEPQAVELDDTTQERTEATTPNLNDKPAATQPERPQVRGPIQFDPPATPPDSPTDDQPDTPNDDAPSDDAPSDDAPRESASPEAEDQDAA
ncbi:MAG TPA: PE-PPE domain-containing protein [Mycobacterium sp.]|nr:PE-PPE domain-containing protein [Mycobacterium sp.]